MKKNILTIIVSVLLKIIFGIGTISLIFIPKLYGWFSDYSFYIQSIFYKLGFYACALISLIIVYGMIRIIDNIYKGGSFKKETEIILKIIAILFMLLAIIVAIKVIFIPTLISFAIALVTFVVSLCFYILSQVFKTAIEYKNEIDYTV